MRLTLDIDNKSRRYLEGKVNLVRRLFPNKKLRVDYSPRKGFHLFVYGLNLNWERVLAYRKLLGDDPRRIAIDKVRWARGCNCQVMFSSKGNEQSRRLI